jgi:hypothetical protein
LGTEGGIAQARCAFATVGKITTREAVAAITRTGATLAWTGRTIACAVTRAGIAVTRAGVATAITASGRFGFLLAWAVIATHSNHLFGGLGRGDRCRCGHGFFSGFAVGG